MTLWEFFSLWTSGSFCWRRACVPDGGERGEYAETQCQTSTACHNTPGTCHKTNLNSKEAPVWQIKIQYLAKSSLLGQAVLVHRVLWTGIYSRIGAGIWKQGFQSANVLNLWLQHLGLLDETLSSMEDISGSNTNAEGAVDNISSCNNGQG